MEASRSSLLALLSIGALSLGGQAPTVRDAVRPGFLAAPRPGPIRCSGAWTWTSASRSCFMVAAYSNKDAPTMADIERLVRQRNIGGLIFSRAVRPAGPAHRPLPGCRPYTIAHRHGPGWGLAMRLDSTFRYPKQMTLGALRRTT